MKTIKIITGLLPTLLFIIPAFAQQKAVAPPSSMTLPTDSAAVSSRPAKKVTVKDSQFNLPDVLILGEDQTRKDITPKQDFVKDRPVLLNPAQEHNPLTTANVFTAAKPGILTAPPGNKRLTWGQLLAGGYSTAIAEAGHWQKLGFSDFNVHGWYDKSKGEYPNSRRKNAGVSGKLQAAFAPGVTGSILGGYEYVNRGMYNALLKDNLRRKITATMVGSELFYGAKGSAHSVLGVEVHNTNMVDDTTAQFEKRDAFRYNLYGNYTHDFNVVQLTLNGRFIRETLDSGLDSSKTKNIFGQIGAEALMRLSPKWIISLGAQYQQSKADSIYKENKVAPFLKLNIMPAKRFGISLKYQSGLQYKTFSEWLAEIPYLYIQGPLPTDYEKHAILANIDYTPIEQLMLYAGVNWRMMESYTFGASYDSTRFVHLQSIPDPQLMDITAGFTTNISAGTQIQASLQWNYEKIKKDPAGKDISHIPYRPEYQIPVSASFEILKGTTLIISADMYGPRTTSLDNENKLNSFSIINIGVKQKFGPFFGHVTVKNLLDSDYALWQYYPENGIFIVGGLSVRF